jgi:hypothetical protein
MTIADGSLAIASECDLCRSVGSRRLRLVVKGTGGKSKQNRILLTNINMLVDFRGRRTNQNGFVGEALSCDAQQMDLSA